MGAGQQQSSTSSTQPWSEQQPYLTKGFSEAEKIYDEGPSSFFPGQTYSDMSDPTKQGLTAQTGVAQDGNPLIGNAAGYASNTLGGNSDNPYASILNPGVSGMTSTANGDFLGNNPYLDSAYDSAANKVTKNFDDHVIPGINASLGMGGNAGSTMHELALGEAGGGLTDSLATLGSDIYGGNYQAERTRQTQAQQGLTSTGAGLYGKGVDERLGAAGLAPGLREAQYGDAAKLRDAGSAYEGQSDKVLEDQINRFNFNENADTASLQDYLAMISGNFGSTSTSRSSTSGSPLKTALGGAATLASLFGGG